MIFLKHNTLQVVIPGYCVAGTVGHKVLSGQKKIELDKKSVVSYVVFTVCFKS